MGKLSDDIQALVNRCPVCKGSGVKSSPLCDEPVICMVHMCYDILSIRKRVLELEARIDDSDSVNPDMAMPESLSTQGLVAYMLIASKVFDNPVRHTKKGLMQPAWGRAELRLYNVKVGSGGIMLPAPVVVAGLSADDARSTMQGLMDYGLKVQDTGQPIRGDELDYKRKLDTIGSVSARRAVKPAKQDAAECCVQSLLDQLWRITGILWKFVREPYSDEVCDPFRTPIPGGPVELWSLNPDEVVFPLSDYERMVEFADFTNGGLRKNGFAERYEAVEAHLEAWYDYRREKSANN